jgi:hypothetical protein
LLAKILKSLKHYTVIVGEAPSKAKVAVSFKTPKDKLTFTAMNMVPGFSGENIQACLSLVFNHCLVGTKGIN